jgi:hypothetical protein
VNNPRIYIILRGGLGNQLHQIAAGVKFAEEHGGLVRIFAHIVDTSVNPERRGFFRSLPINQLFPGANLKQVNRIENFVLRASLRFFPALVAKRIVTESNFHDSGISRVALLQGWFQSHAYIPRNFRPEVLVSLEEIVPDKIIIHVRLTDFLELDKFPLSKEYYREAINEMTKMLGIESFSCFSDDLGEVGLFLPADLVVEFPEKKGKIDPVELLKSLSSGSGLICSRSSLCWWAAQIASSRGGLVISPWKGEVHHDDWLSLDPTNH